MKKLNTEKIKKSDKIMIGATIVIALGTLVSAGAICFQWHEMHTGGVDTKAIADAAQKQACAAQHFADTASLINGNVNDAVKKLDAQAKATEASRKSSELAATKALNAAIDNARTDQRAWLDVVIYPPSYFQGDKPFSTAAELKNLGKTPAKNIRFGYIFEGVAPSPNPTFDDSRLRFVDAGMLPPQGPSTLPVEIAPGHPDELLGDGRFGAIRDGNLAVFFWGMVTYDDTFGVRHWLKFAYIYNVPHRKFDLVNTHNDIDPENR